MRSKKRWWGCGAVFLVICCGGGGLVLTTVGRSMAEKSRTIGSTTEQAQRLGMITEKKDLGVKVAPPDVDARPAILKFNDHLKKTKVNLPRIGYLLISGYGTSADWARAKDFVDEVRPDLAFFKEHKSAIKISYPEPTGELYPTFYYGQVIQALCFDAILSVRQGRLNEGNQTLDAAISLMKANQIQATTVSMFNRLSDEIFVIRAAERAADFLPTDAEAADFLERIRLECEKDFSLRKGQAAEVGFDTLLIETGQNKLWQEAPFGQSVKDLYRASIIEYWLKFFPQIPESLDEIDQAEEVFKLMRKAGKANPIIQNGASYPSWIVQTGRDLLARRRLMAAAIDTFRGKPITEIDPYSGKPLKSIRRNGRTVLYSFGRDRIDDHGKPRGRGPKFPTTYDLLYTLPSSRSNRGG